MTLEETFNDWLRIINQPLLMKTLEQVPLDKPICPCVEYVFKAFQLCSLKNCKAVMLGLDPYPQKGVATGILFGNNADVRENNLSPSLKVIKDAAINYKISHNYPIEFDNTLESWAAQGILMLNSALTVEQNRIGSHTMIWRPFIADLLSRLSQYDKGIVFVLFGEAAQTFTPYIKANIVFKEKHPSYYARTNKNLSSELFNQINNAIFAQYGEKIIWFKDYNMFDYEQED